MSKSSQVQRLPVEVDPFRLVEQGRIYQGRIPIGDHPRLKELLFVGDANTTDDASSDILVDVKLEFTKTDTRLPVIKGNISTSFSVPCQRCLEAETVKFDTDIKVVLVSTDAQADKLQEGYDTWLVEDQRLFLQDFIEDEILLAMPNIVMHEVCESAKELIEALPEDHIDVIEGENEQTQEKKNPFAVLKDLKLS